MAKKAAGSNWRLHEPVTLTQDEILGFVVIDTTPWCIFADGGALGMVLAEDVRLQRQPQYDIPHHPV